MTRKELTEALALALVEADPTITGLHPEHVVAKMPAAGRIIAALEAAGFAVVPREGTVPMFGASCDAFADGMSAIWRPVNAP